MTTTLEEFIEKQAMNEVLTSAATPHALKGCMEATAAEILRVAEERCNDHFLYGEGRIIDEHNSNHSWGNTYSANDLLELIKSYITGPSTSEEKK